MTPSLYPGQKLDMRVLFLDVDSDGNSCPQCFIKAATSTSTRVQWYYGPRSFWIFKLTSYSTVCAMWFQRVGEVVDSHTTLSSRQIRTEDALSPRLTRVEICPGDFARVRLLQQQDPGCLLDSDFSYLTSQDFDDRSAYGSHPNVPTSTSPVRSSQETQDLRLSIYEKVVRPLEQLLRTGWN